MPRYKAKYTIFKRGKIWYYRLGDDPKRVHHSTGQTLKGEAVKFVEEILKKRKQSPIAEKSLQEYLPEALKKYIKLRIEDGNPLSKDYCKDSKRYIKYIRSDPIADKALGEVSFADLEDFKMRTLEKFRDRRNTASQVLKTLKLLLHRAYRRQEIQSDPSGVDPIKIKSKVRQIYTSEQLECLFPPEPWEEGNYNPWSGIHDYTAFLLAVCTGLRRKEVLGLQWEAVFLEENIPYVVVVEELAKSKKQRATPFFDQVIFGDEQAVRAMRQLKACSSRKTAKVMNMSGAPVEGYVFGYADGSPCKETWWNKHLKKALENAGIDRGGDEKTMPLDAHSFRHTLASNLKSRGMPDDLIRTFCGWSSLNVQSNYTHFDPDLIQHYTQWMSKQA